MTEPEVVKGALGLDTQLRLYAPLVRRLARHMVTKMPPNVEVDDLIQVGMLGLAEAISRFEPTQGVQFEAFANQRIRGAMTDELRRGDWVSRSSRKSQKDIEQAVSQLQQKLHRSPLESEIAQKMDLPLASYQRLLAKVLGTQLVYLEDISGHDDEDGFSDQHAGESDPSDVLQNLQMRAALVAAIKLLSEREQQIMGMHYEHDMNLKEIAVVLGVTASRICQLHGQSIARLRAKLKGPK